MIGELGLWELINKCPHLKFKFAGVYAADNFPIKLDKNTFVVVNSDNSDQEGTHWVVYCRTGENYAFGDPLGLFLHNYKNIYERLVFADLNVIQLIDYPLQPPTSNLCGLYCIYIAHHVFGENFPTIPTITETGLIRFLNHMQ